MIHAVLLKNYQELSVYKKYINKWPSGCVTTQLLCRIYHDDECITEKGK